MAFKLKELVPTEHQEHMSLMHWIRLQPDIDPYFIHIPNEGKRHPVTGYILRRKGLKSGVSDFFLAKPRGSKGGMWLELKRRKLGVISDSQKSWIELMLNVGYEAKICYGWEDAVRCIEEYLMQ